MSRLFVALFCLFVAAGAGAACTAQSSPNGPHLVELYTSEGCSSCPPAEKWMSSLATKPEYVGLEFHVDYWDSSEWRDPFDSKSYTQRQQMLVKREKSQPYTPQIFLDGALWHNWPSGDPPSGFAGAKPTLNLDAKVADSIAVHVASSDVNTAAGQRVFVALTENGLSHSVRGGENKGRTLAHDQVVRAFAGPFDKSDVQTTLKIPDKTDLSKSSVVAFVQDEKGGPVSQVVRLPLNECTK